MNKKCIVLGAGFSKAIADLPLTKEIFDSFEKELDKQKKLDASSNHVQRGERIFCFLDDLQKNKIEDPYNKSTNGGKIIKVENWSENFEGICSYIDLNLSFEVISFTKDKKGEEGHLDSPPFELDKTYLSEIRRDIALYLYLVLINRRENGVLLGKFYERFLYDRPSIITFNYDLVLENYLFEIGDWFPRDGYGITLPIKTKLNFPDSKIKIYKLHGSLNWVVNSGEIELEWNNDPSSKNFPVYPIDEDNMYCSPNAWMLPSFIKQFSYLPLIQVWNQAANQLKLADEIFFIGYSLPLADSAVYSFLSTIDFTNKRVEIINPTQDVEELLANYSKALRKNKNEINLIPIPLEKLLE